MSCQVRGSDSRPCEHLKRSTHASLEFESLFRCEPEPGDVLSYEHVAAWRGPEFNAKRYLPFIAGWERQLPDLICPLKFEQGRLFKLEHLSGQWVEKTDIHPQAHWRRIEWEAMPEAERHGSSEPDPIETVPTIPAVVFLGMVERDGGPLVRQAHGCRPITEEELKRANLSVCRDTEGKRILAGFTRLALGNQVG